MPEDIYRDEKDNIAVTLYRNHRGELEIDVSNDCESVALSVHEAFVLLQLMSKLFVEASLIE